MINLDNGIEMIIMLLFIPSVITYGSFKKDDHYYFCMMQVFLESQGIELNPPEKMALDPYTELRKQPLRKYVTPSDFDQLKQFLTFDKQVSN